MICIRDCSIKGIFAIEKPASGGFYNFPSCTFEIKLKEEKVT